MQLEEVYSDDIYRHLVFPDPASRFVTTKTAISFPAASSRGYADELSSAEVRFLRWLFARAGLELEHYKHETLSRRLPACLRMLRVRSVADAHRLIERDPRLGDIALSAVLIGMTRFFRDPIVFELLGDKILPELIATGGPVRVWSAGCSDGSEIYSIALLLAEMRVQGNLELLGTDCRAEALRLARAASYLPAAADSIAGSLLARYFAFDGMAWRLHSPIRNAVDWEQSEVFRCRSPKPWDMILCRNLAIYLSREANEKLWIHLESQLRPGGFLITGAAERPYSANSFSRIENCIYRKNWHRQ